MNPRMSQLAWPNVMILIMSLLHHQYQVALNSTGKSIV